MSKKIIAVVILISILTFSLGANLSFAQFSDVPVDASYKEALDRLVNIGIFVGSNSNFNPEKSVTREEMAKIIVSTAGLDNEAIAYAGTSIFNDVSAAKWSSGYIRVAVEKGLMTASLNGNFDPTGEITYAEACTILVQALGYIDKDLTGIWPYNCINKAKEIGITTGIELSANDSVPRWNIVLMIDKFMATNMKDNKGTFAGQTGDYLQSIVLANYHTDRSLSENQVRTDNGTIILSGDVEVPTPGYSAIFRMSNGLAYSAGIAGYNYMEFSVENISGNTIYYTESGVEKSYTLPSNIQYYDENGLIQGGNITANIENGSSIILAMDTAGATYVYGTIISPVYGQPVVVGAGTIKGYYIGTINTSGKNIIREGKVVAVSQIDLQDVVYLISDIWGENQYVLAIDNQVSGTIENILPSKISPNSVVIGGKTYILSSDFPKSKLGIMGTYSVGDSITLSLGYDGMAVGTLYTSEYDNSGYAVVLDSYQQQSNDIEDNGTIYYMIKLLKADGTTDLFRGNNSSTLNYKGDLVTYKSISSDGDYEIISLEKINPTSSSSYLVDKDNEMINGHYIADNIAIFNIVEKTLSDGVEVDATVLNWNSIPSGCTEPGKVNYMHYAGDFQDVDVMLTTNILEENIAIGVIEAATYTQKSGSIGEYSYSVLVNGEDYIVKGNLPGAGVGSVVEVLFKNNKVTGLLKVTTNTISSNYVQAIDSSRIMLNGKVYRFGENITIYENKTNGSYQAVGINALVKGKSYGNIAVYFDKSVSYGGEVAVIIFY